MRWLSYLLLFGGIVPGLGLTWSPFAANSQGVGCLNSDLYIPRTVGTPDAEGVTVADSLINPAEKHGFSFSVTQRSAASLYVGDQWFDLALYLYQRGRCPAGSWEKLVSAWSSRSESMVLQFVRPDEQILNLDPGEYLLLVGYKYAEDPDVPGFDPSHGFTVRIALNPPYCGLAIPDVLQPNPVDPSVLMPRRPDDALYQLALTLQPDEEQLSPFSLMTFNAFVSPPFMDLYDFEWVIDGQPVDGVDATVQLAATDLARTANGQHKIRVKAVGARPYPDPALTHIPPTLAVECTFRFNL